MNLSANTIKVLSNFSSINPSILITPGNEIRTYAPTKNFYACCKVTEKFESQAGIGDLLKFLGIVTLLESPDLDFKENQVVISSGKRRVNYTYDHPSTILTREKGFTLPSKEVNFSLADDILTNIIKVSKVLGSPDIKVSGADGKLSISAVDSENPTADSYVIELGDTEKVFNFFFKKELISKLLPSTYDVTISAKGMAIFISNDLEYHIAVERNSSYKG